MEPSKKVCAPVLLEQFKTECDKGKAPDVRAVQECALDALNESHKQEEVTAVDKDYKDILKKLKEHEQKPTRFTWLNKIISFLFGHTIEKKYTAMQERFDETKNITESRIKAEKIVRAQGSVGSSKGYSQQSPEETQRRKEIGLDEDLSEYHQPDRPDL